MISANFKRLATIFCQRKSVEWRYQRERTGDEYDKKEFIEKCCDIGSFLG